MNEIKHTTIIIVSLAVVLGLSVYQYVASRPKPQPLISSAAPRLEPSPTPTVAFAPVRVDSPDGTKTLIMKHENKDGNDSYTFSVSGISDNREVLIVSRTTSQGNSFTIPDNTWSPDDIYAFIQEHTTEGTRYFVLSTKNHDFENTDIHALFSEKYPEYVLKEITGWGGTNLLILNTKDKKGFRGPSFWFDLTNQSFIQLGTQF